MAKAVLVVDDRPANLSALRKKYEKAGFKVLEAATLKEAVKRVRQAQKNGDSIRQVVTDLDLGSKLSDKLHIIDGYRFAQWCRREMPNARVTLHSSAFEAERPIRRWLTGLLRKRAVKKGIKVQPKSVLLPGKVRAGKRPR